jgi:hypothetical protein
MKKQDANKLSQLMCYRCHEVEHIAMCCPTKKSQVETKAKPQAQVKINHEDDDDLMKKKKKKKTKRGGRARHPIQIQDVKMMSKNQNEKKVHAHIECFKCEDMGHFASGCPTKLQKKIQATREGQGNEKQHMSKEEKA